MERSDEEHAMLKEHGDGTLVPGQQFCGLRGCFCKFGVKARALPRFDDAIKLQKGHCCARDQELRSNSPGK